MSTETNEAKRGKRIKALRKRIGMTQQQLADALESYGAKALHTTISMWETGDVRPSNDDVVSLANLFGVTTDYLLCSPGADSPQWVDAEGKRIPHPPEVEQAVKALLIMEKPVRRTIIRHLPQIEQAAKAAIAEAKTNYLESAKALDEDGLADWELGIGVKLF